jgi:hypothetical protein
LGKRAGGLNGGRAERRKGLKGRKRQSEEIYRGVFAALREIILWIIASVRTRISTEIPIENLNKNSDGRRSKRFG